jgi:hypothetical protein
MRQTLDKKLRTDLEKTVIKAREIAETSSNDELIRLGVSENNAPNYLSEDERKLRNKLRAHGRQLGDVLAANGKQEISLLVNEMAYEYWHRMIFARFLEQSNLLMYDKNMSLTIEECHEIAPDEGAKDGWELAGRLAEKMLPQVFRADSPIFQVKLASNHIKELDQLIAKLDKETFQASDSLGWLYQFWQSKRKDEVNKSEVKIGSRELSPVTQLFTEPYMVSFLLDNALGAWWAGQTLTQDDLTHAISEQELRHKAAIDGVPLEYLRFVKQKDEAGTESWTPAAGTFDKWPAKLSELKTLDPCCGSGHFLVATFLMLVPMRMTQEGLSATEAIAKVLTNNLHGLELDQRCVELAAFALALEAWRYPDAGGYRALPELHIACSGLSIASAKDEWKQLAKGKEDLTQALDWLQTTFKDAPTLGSLIDPKKSKGAKQDDWSQIENNLNQLLGQDNSDEKKEATVVAQGMIKAASLLADEYNWVITNVPYLARGKQVDKLKDFSEKYYPAGKNDLATVFLDRCLELCVKGGSSSIVLPQNWLFLTSYKKFREKLLKNDTWNIIARLGPKGFQTPMWDFNVQLITLTSGNADPKHLLHGVDVSEPKTADGKAIALLSNEFKGVIQTKQLSYPDSRISFSDLSSENLFSGYASSIEGLTTGDMPRFIQQFWEREYINSGWSHYIGSVTTKTYYGGRDQIVYWQDGKGDLVNFKSAHNFPSKIMNGQNILGKKGIRIGQMGNLEPTITNGEVFDKNAANVVAHSNDLQDLAAFWCFVEDDKYSFKIREIDQALKVTNASFLKIEYDIKHWTEIAGKKYPNGLPHPYTNDPTQWIYHGHPCSSVVWNEELKWTTKGALRQDDTVLHTAVARLLGYQWPAELDTKMDLAEEVRELIKESGQLKPYTDDDGIVCLPSVWGEKSADVRLEALLQASYGEAWSANVLNELLTSVKAKSLTAWLRDKFFDQHSRMFQHRPFIWQIWDGQIDGFSVLVNYHTFDHAKLERLIYTYLGDWIRTQEHGVKEGLDGADILLTAALKLKDKLEAIKAGEKGLDIFVRWKSLAEQAIGWNPDLNDGVRLNIRPFLNVGDVGKKGAGILCGKPNIHWKKDRGTDVDTAPWFDLGPKEFNEKPGSRINDHYLSLADKKQAREEKKQSESEKMELVNE